MLKQSNSISIKRDANNIIVVVEKDPKCKVFPNLNHNKFVTNKNNKFFEMHNAIRKRLIDMG